MSKITRLVFLTPYPALSTWGGIAAWLCLRAAVIALALCTGLAAAARVFGAEMAQGEVLAFVSARDGNHDIYLVDVRRHWLHNLTRQSEAYNSSPRWSPDGQQLAFVSNRDGASEIYVMDSDGRNVRQLTVNTANDFSPAWSPDGQQLAFTLNQRRDAEIFLMNLNGENVRQLTDNRRNDYSPVWSPDGRTLAFASNLGGNWDVYTMASECLNLAGGCVRNTRRLTTHAADDYSPAWSPDGTEIAFVSNRDGDWEIFVMGSDGSSPRQLTHNNSGEFWPAWSPDGRLLAFVSHREEAWDIYVMDADCDGLTGACARSESRLTWGGFYDGEPAWRP